MEVKKNLKATQTEKQKTKKLPKTKNKTRTKRNLWLYVQNYLHPIITRQHINLYKMEVNKHTWYTKQSKQNSLKQNKTRPTLNLQSYVQTIYIP